MMLLIIAGLAGFVLVVGVGFLLIPRRAKPEPTAWQKPRHSYEWDSQPEVVGGSRPSSVLPPSGVPREPTLSEELSLESQELYIDIDDEPTGPVSRIVLTAAGGTDPGRRREHNEDAFLVYPEHEVYAIADGMGGYAAGEVASQIAVDTLRDAFEQGDFGEHEEGYPRRGAELVSVIRRANTKIRDEANEDRKKSGMGTTIVSTRFSPGRKRVYVAHVGDSRCYRIRDGVMKQLTTDHTLGAVGMTGKAADKLSRAVGVFDDVDVDLTIDEPLPGDFYLLCSDGLFKMLSDEEIVATVLANPELERAVEKLIAEANDHGGRDNVTVVLVQIDEPDFDPVESGEHRLPG